MNFACPVDYATFFFLFLALINHEQKATNNDRGYKYFCQQSIARWCCLLILNPFFGMNLVFDGQPVWHDFGLWTKRAGNLALYL